VRECFYLDPADWYHHTVVPPHLRMVAAAAWAQQVIRMDYESWTARKWRTVEPLGLVLKAGRWYLVASGSDRKRPGIFKLEAIHGVEVLPQVFRPPKYFDLARTWKALMEQFEISLRRERARIRVSPNALSRLDRLGSATAETVRMAAPDRLGWREAQIWIEGVSHAASLFLGFGVDIEVLAPAALRADIAKRARNVCALYGGRGKRVSAGTGVQQRVARRPRRRA
jgi:predicted DNA-binding transcriptional regulator YafY